MLHRDLSFSDLSLLYFVFIKSSPEKECSPKNVNFTTIKDSINDTQRKQTLKLQSCVDIGHGFKVRIWNMFERERKEMEKITFLINVIQQIVEYVHFVE